jgi:uncharacterized protein YndB with AHSA1/START domain
MSDRDIVITRVFAASRQRVFDAHTRPELLKRWFGPHGWQLSVCEVDLSPGGAWRYVMAGPGGQRMVLHGAYLEIDAPNRLVMTENNGDCHARAEYEALVTLDFAGETVLTNTASFPTRAVRDAVVASGMTGGVDQAYDRLTEDMGAEAWTGRSR